MDPVGTMTFVIVSPPCSLGETHPDIDKLMMNTRNFNNTGIAIMLHSGWHYLLMFHMDRVIKKKE